MKPVRTDIRTDKILIRGGLVLTMLAEEEPEVGDVFIAGDRILAVAPGPPPFRAEEASTVIEANDCLVMPGLINAHTHTPMTLTRSTSDGIGFPSPGGPASFPRGKDWRGQLTSDDLGGSSRLAIAEMIRSGTTTFVDMFHDMGRVAEAVVDTGIRAALGSEFI